MKNILTTTFSLLIAVSMMAQQTFNDANAEVRDVKNFRGIKVGTGIQLVLTQGSTEAVAISAPTEEQRNHIRTVVENGILKIYYDYDMWKLMRGKIHNKLKAYVSIVNVEYIGVASGATLETNGEITGNVIELKASSGGIMKAKLKAKTLNADQSSGGVVTISGTADNISIESSSGAIFDGYGMVVNTCSARSNSGGVAKVTVNSEISGRASSGGTIHYRGQAKLVSKRMSSGGVVGKAG